MQSRMCKFVLRSYILCLSLQLSLRSEDVRQAMINICMLITGTCLSSGVLIGFF